jgi:hypothetical protein
VQIGAVVPFQIDVDDYWRSFEAAGYTTRDPEYYASHIYEKSLEHYIAARLVRTERRQREAAREPRADESHELHGRQL